MTSKGRRPASILRESSLELGSPRLATHYNQQTGRPIRDGAGKKRKHPDYVDSVIIEEDIPVESCSEDEDGNLKRPKRVIKRKRTPSPSPPPLSPIIQDAMSSREVTPTPSPPNGDLDRPICLTFNIPQGFQGPFVVKLDRGLLDGNGQGSRSRDQGTTISRVERRSYFNTTGRRPQKQPRKVTVSSHSNIGFLTLPPELRNKIYRLLFIAKQDLIFYFPDNFCLSSAFLRTCNQVHEEGRSILYGENTFVFERNKYTRAPLWSPTLKEIGYKDMRLFLKLIGPRNLSMIRDMRIVFEDAMPSSTPYLHSQEARRFVNDEHLIDCLHILENQAKLREVSLSFHGRRCLQVDVDVRFLETLAKVKADQVTITNSQKMPYSEVKAHPEVRRLLREAMIRNPPLHTVLQNSAGNI
ncbi:hypothetical protein AOQ84DRAFT_111179 [Glonium stellatum]|uniref:F-box domain-containing protein n=1 Tax=Glonium stellatum TaxID=574774 RepID=A0A8E2JXQ5_9PEZI|nr:hypothetical protein AOQ84DRAFT_111179 [Glonium stellatum]